MCSCNIDFDDPENSVLLEENYIPSKSLLRQKSFKTKETGFSKPIYVQDFMNESNDSVLLPVAKTTIHQPSKTNPSSKSIHILIDTASSSNFITVGTCSMFNSSLQIIAENINLNVTTLHGEQHINSECVRVVVNTKQKPIEIEAFVVPHIRTIPETFLPQEFDVYRSQLTESFPRPEIEINLLMGMKSIPRVLKKNCVYTVLPSGTMCILPTVWGVVPCGRASIPEPPAKSVFRPRKTESFLTGTERIAQILERSWKLEELPHDNSPSSLSKDEVQAVEQIENILQYDEERKRFITGLLWREAPDLLNNYQQAFKRTERLRGILRDNPELREAYTDAINDFDRLGVIEKVTDPDAAQSSRTDLFYLPHRAVYDADRVSTKCRVVFDASAKTPSGKSLNHCLLPGPPLQVNIIAVELRFRLRKYALVGDISKMFLNIDVKEEDRNFLRFLWRNPMERGPPYIYRFKALIFGAKDSPFQAISSLQRLAREKKATPDITFEEKRACDIIMDDTYVDDITTGAETLEDLESIYHNLTKILHKGHFKVKKWCSNTNEIAKFIPQENLLPLGETISKTGQVSTGEKNASTLGVRWNPRMDNIVYDQHKHIQGDEKNTKTSLASISARLFDPLGLISPYILLAKRILKQTHIEQLNWKDKLTVEMKTEWQKWVVKIADLQHLQFPRYVPNSSSSEYHIFGAASFVGYTAVAYIRTFLPEKNLFVSNILFARTKIAPMKEKLKSRLELMAALLCTTLAEQLRVECGIEKDRIFCWMDSEIILWWLIQKPALLAPFVSNRVTKIQELEYSFQYSSTKENPAAIASRGCYPSHLCDDLWQHGPQFLRKNRKDWEFKKIDLSKLNTKDGLKKREVFAFLSLEINMRKHPQKRVPIFELYSSFDKILRITAIVKECCVKWRAYKKNKEASHNQSILPQEGGLEKDAYNIEVSKRTLKFAFRFWIKKVQLDAFPHEVKQLQQGKGVFSSSSLKKLDPKLDKYGVMRVGGRIERASIDEDIKHPILLPKQHLLTKHIVWEAHEKNQHAGIDWVHFHLRQKFWIMSSRQIIRSILRKCQICLRKIPLLSTNRITPLPSSKTNPNEAFVFVGLDYMTEVLLQKEEGETANVMAHILLFTCMTTRGIHLELVLDESKEEFLMAFQRLCDTRGRPTHMYSDKALAFEGAERHLLKTIKTANQEIHKVQHKYKFEWHYSEENEPASKGFRERMAKSIRQAFTKVMKNAALTYIEFITALKEIEAMVNDRPLTSTTNETLEILTPSMLMIGRKLRPWVVRFDLTCAKSDRHLRQRWLHRTVTCKAFWSFWSKHYQNDNQRRGKWFTKQPLIKPGDLVMLEVDTIQSGKWPIAKVINLRIGRGDVIRSIELSSEINQGKKGKVAKLYHFTRDLRSIYPLEENLDNQVENT